jgi:hypothetical protein
MEQLMALMNSSKPSPAQALQRRGEWERPILQGIQAGGEREAELLNALDPYLGALEKTQDDIFRAPGRAFGESDIGSKIMQWLEGYKPAEAGEGPGMAEFGSKHNSPSGASMEQIMSLLPEQGLGNVPELNGLDLAANAAYKGAPSEDAKMTQLLDQVVPRWADYQSITGK